MSKKKTIAEHARDVCIEWELEAIDYGHLNAIHEVAERSGMYERDGSTHPLAINNRVLSALDNSKMFEKSYIKYMGRPARYFTLKEEYK